MIEPGVDQRCGQPEALAVVKPEEDPCARRPLVVGRMPIDVRSRAEVGDAARFPPA
jgi:hypothetical protein